MITLFIFVALFHTLCTGAVIEEFQAHDPQEFHKAAMDKFMEMRRSDPTQNLSYDGEFMKMANKRAIERNIRRPDEALQLRVSSSLVLFNVKHT